MELDEYLFKNKLTVTEFAAKINYSPGRITQIKNKRFTPGRKMARAILDATHEQVDLRKSVKYQRKEYQQHSERTITYRSESTIKLETQD